MKMENVTIIPYLSFDGCCEEAISTYIQAFSGEVYYLSMWTEATFDKSPEQIGKVISPLKPHPAPDDGGCGSITKDRFGYTWIITCPNPDKK